MATPKAAQRVWVSVVMGSDSDLKTMGEALEALKLFGVPFEVRIVSAHRTPRELVAYASTLRRRGVRVVIAGAGGAAHLPGMVAALTELPVIGVPVAVGALAGQDALLSIVQMPRGVPVASVAIGGAFNAGLLAIQILAGGGADRRLLDRLKRYKAGLRRSVKRRGAELARSTRRLGRERK